MIIVISVRHVLKKIIVMEDLFIVGILTKINQSFVLETFYFDYEVINRAGKLYIDDKEIPSLIVVHRDPNLTSLTSTGGIYTGIFFTAGMLSMLAAAYVIKKCEDCLKDDSF